jgi:transcriptional regulator with XRE-family HTH domain
VPITRAQKQKLKILGKRIKALREERGLTLKELAYSIGKDPQSIHRLEMGDVNPSYLYLMDVCIGLEISISELLDLDKN